MSTISIEKILKARRNYYQNRIRNSEAQLDALPEGQLQIARNGSRYRWRFSRLKQNSSKSETIEISAGDEKLAARLALRKYLEQLICDDKKEIAAIDSYFKKHIDKIHGEVKVKFVEEFWRLLGIGLTDVYSKWDTICQEWMAEPYSQSIKNLEEKILLTKSGIKVRSKSEKFIADVLFLMHIPFRYEPLMDINGNTLCPDFMIMHPITHRIYIWEHDGWMDRPNYAHKKIAQLADYYDAGFILNDNLIITVEMRNQPFLEEDAWETAEKFFAA